MFSKPLPTKRSILSRVLCLMIDGKARTRWDVNRAIGVDPEKEVTARLRDLRKIGLKTECISSTNEDGKQLWYYRLKLGVNERPVLMAYKYVAEHLGSTLPEVACYIGYDEMQTAHFLSLTENLNRIVLTNEKRKCRITGEMRETLWIK